MTGRKKRSCFGVNRSSQKRKERASKPPNKNTPFKSYNGSRGCAGVESTNLPKPKVAIYGLTTEGYTIASKIVDVASVTIVDDTLQMAMDLTPQLVKSHSTLQELVGGESLMGLKPIPQVLVGGQARLLHAQSSGRPGTNPIIESNMKVREVAAHVSKGSTIVNTLPMGIGGNSDNIAVIEKQTGMKVGETINYAYCPLRPRGEPGVIALSAKMRESLSPEEIGMKSAYGGIAASELAYVSSVLNESASIAVDVELMRKARSQSRLASQEGGVGKREGEKYIDDLAAFVYDLTAVQASEDVGEPLTYMAGAALRSLENDVRYIVDETQGATSGDAAEGEQDEGARRMDGRQVRDARRQDEDRRGAGGEA